MIKQICIDVKKNNKIYQNMFFPLIEEQSYTY